MSGNESFCKTVGKEGRLEADECLQIIFSTVNVNNPFLPVHYNIYLGVKVPLGGM